MSFEACYLFGLAHGYSLFVDDVARVLVLIGRRVDNFLILGDLGGVGLQPPPPLLLPSRVLLWLHHPPFPLGPVLVLCLNTKKIDKKTVDIICWEEKATSGGESMIVPMMSIVLLCLIWNKNFR